MKTTGVSGIPKFGLLDFLGHPNVYECIRNDTHYLWYSLLSSLSYHAVCICVCSLLFMYIVHHCRCSSLLSHDNKCLTAIRVPFFCSRQNNEIPLPILLDPSIESHSCTPAGNHSKGHISLIVVLPINPVT